MSLASLMILKIVLARRKSNLLFWVTTSKLYVLLPILADCFTTPPVKGAPRTWLFGKDFGKSQICNRYNLLSFHDFRFHDSLFHDANTSKYSQRVSLSDNRKSCWQSISKLGTLELNQLVLIRFPTSFLSFAFFVSVEIQVKTHEVAIFKFYGEFYLFICGLAWLHWLSQVSTMSRIGKSHLKTCFFQLWFLKKKFWSKYT